MSRKRKNIEEFIEESIKIHGTKYDYSKSIYLGVNHKINIICPSHGDFEQIVKVHLNGHGCPQCRNDFYRETRKSNNDEFILKANRVHNNKYLYNKSVYKNRRSPIIIVCPIHGEFTQLVRYHLDGNGCPKCKLSKGENEIMHFFDVNNIQYETQKTFDDCRNKIKLRFDFYLPEQNMLIEYDGEQHFKVIEYLGSVDGYNYRVKNDIIKTEYAENNNIKLLRISYNDRKNVTEILKNNLKI